MPRPAAPPRRRDRRPRQQVELFVKTKGRLFHSGVSQPPFLLALAGRYHKLPLAWNVRGLGRLDIGRGEWQALRSDASSAADFDASIFERHMAPAGPFAGRFNPFFQPLAASAKVLHFNGELKPWALAPTDASRWQLLGLNMTVDVDGVPRVLGTCRLKVCPYAVEVSLDPRGNQVNLEIRQNFAKMFRNTPGSDAAHKEHA